MDNVPLITFEENVNITYLRKSKKVEDRSDQL